MPPSQLKRLKASLREQGIVGPQKSKKQKKKISQNGVGNDKRVQRTVALNGIREQFNPFEFQTSARGPKFEVTTNRTIGGKASKSVKARPGWTRGLGEENRRKTLLVEMQRRNKVGGIMDRRFGENDPQMAPEEKMLERFTREIQRRHKNTSAFDLEDDDEQADLTHMGQSLSLNGPTLADDFNEEELELSGEEDHPADESRGLLKRRRSSESEDSVEDEGGEELPEKKKSKQEVMKEVIAKSKLFKYERQAAKDEDEDVREEIDKEMPELQEILRGLPPRPAAPKRSEIPGMNPDRLALLNDSEREKLDKEFDMRQRKMAQDKKSKPTERTKTEEEKLADESRKLRDLEASRLQRMQGDLEDDEIDERIQSVAENQDLEDEEDFGFGSGIKARDQTGDLGIEDEDDFIIDDGLVASDSEISTSEDEDSSMMDENEDGNFNDDEFIDGLLVATKAKGHEFLTGANEALPEKELPKANGVNGNLAYVFQCPQSHEELLRITKDVVVEDLPTVVRRIRSLYHPQLKGENKEKLGKFTVALIDHIYYLANQSQPPPFNVLETLMRHVHSLSGVYSIEAANAFRLHLDDLHRSRALSPNSGDLILLTAVGSIFPTSDHFHQVVTPAMLSMARYLGQKLPQILSDYSTGIYIATLCLQYQRLSRRYIPEVIGFLLNTLCNLAPVRFSKTPGTFYLHQTKEPLRLGYPKELSVRKMNLLDIAKSGFSLEEETEQKAAVLETTIKLLDVAMDIWITKPSFNEIFSPALAILKHLGSKTCQPNIPSSIQISVSKTITKLTLLLSQSKHSRRPLLLHNHRPLAIKTSIPKFEESFNPTKHYDPDRERAESSKLRAEHKKERKGAMRELRKDANFIARESLREKKERDEKYEKKYRRLVAEIQGEEGREKKVYEREREWRRKGKK